MSRIKSVLKKFGLTENQIKVYLAILKKEKTTHSDLSKKTKIARTTVYDIVSDLKELDLISQEQSSGSSFIVPNNPNHLKQLLKERFSELRELEEDVTSIIPSLLDKSKDQKGQSEQMFWEGIEGARKAYFCEGFESLTQTRHIITDLNSFNAFGRDDLKNKYPYEIKELVPINEWVKFIFKKRLGEDPGFVKQRDYRYIEHPLFTQYTRTTIIGDKVFHACAYKNESWGMMIDSDAYSASIKSFFDYLWSKSKKLSAETIKKWPEITMPNGTLDSPSLKIEGGRVERV